MGKKFRVGDMVFISVGTYKESKTVGEVRYISYLLHLVQIIVIFDTDKSLINKSIVVPEEVISKVDIKHVQQYPYIAPFVKIPSENFFLDE